MLIIASLLCVLLAGCEVAEFDIVGAGCEVVKFDIVGTKLLVHIYWSLLLISNNKISLSID